ncbi:hypothetical protein P5673_011723 [Acropora cervicornis]|uniref:Uncharacterized protein n=1 Tax=Acropora cervicornis TaxID=6130 RepID=A0AAD9V8D9_ACRCE|nr:hypothetical protein P5673_011723 [Acropora cervicornis]
MKDEKRLYFDISVSAAFPVSEQLTARCKTIFHAFQTHGDLINEQTTTTKIHSPFDTASAGARNLFKVNLQGKSRLEFQGKI